MSEHRAFSASAALLDLKRVAGRARIRTAAARELATVVAGGGIAQLGRELVLRVHRYEHIEPPAALAVGATSFDVGRDLVNYTGLPPDEVDRLLRRRSDSFRAEWYTTPRKRRLDAWFYLASSTYLFGNAVHDPLPQLKLLRDRGIRPGRALDFGGGTGNLALAMAAAGWTVDYLEHSALQKDFVAYRLNAYGFADRVRVLDDWRPIAAETYDLVVAIDVLEHVADLERLLTREPASGNSRRRETAGIFAVRSKRLEPDAPRTQGFRVNPRKRIVPPRAQLAGGTPLETWYRRPLDLDDAHEIAASKACHAARAGA